MRATVSLDDELLRRAQEVTGLSEPTALLQEGLRALIEQGSARRLTVREGSMPGLKPIRRQRAADL